MSGLTEFVISGPLLLTALLALVAGSVSFASPARPIPSPTTPPLAHRALAQLARVVQVPTRHSNLAGLLRLIWLLWCFRPGGGFTTGRREAHCNEMSNHQDNVISGSEAPARTAVVRVNNVVPVQRSARDVTPTSTSTSTSAWACHEDYLMDWVHDRYLDGC